MTTKQAIVVLRAAIKKDCLEDLLPVRAEAEQVLMAELEALRGALAPFGTVKIDPIEDNRNPITIQKRVGDYRLAREIYERTAP